MSEYVQQKSWFSRNWLWVVPVSGCLIIILLLIFGVGAAIFGVTKLMTGSEPYEYALEKATNDPIVIQYLGDAIESNGMMQGNISLNNNSGQANITIPIKGNKDKGVITVVGKKNNGEWIYEELYVKIKEKNITINLIDKGLEGI